jgi:hypothetical protein
MIVEDALVRGEEGSVDVVDPRLDDALLNRNVLRCSSN